MSGWIKLLGPSLLLGAACVLPAAAAPGTYETVLGPTPINHTTKSSLLGEGAAVATLTGSTLKISGTFQGMSGAASDAHIMMGEAIGIPGNPILDLTTTAASNGSISGTFKLNKVQLAALRAGKLYIQINSSVGPAPGGNLWGWLLPEHVKAGQDEPLMGDWFLPQGEGLRAGRSNTKS